MKNSVLLLGAFTSLGLTACDTNYKIAKVSSGQQASATSTGSTSLPSTTILPTATTTSPPPPATSQPPIPSIGPALVTAIGSLITGVITSDPLSLGDSINGSIPCPYGGTLSISGSASLTISSWDPLITSATANQAETLAFTNCQLLRGVVLNGQVSVTNWNFNSDLVYLSSPESFSAQLTSQIVGNLNVSYGSLSETCALTVSDSLSIQSAVSSLMPFSESGNAVTSVSGSLCGVNLSEQVTQAL